MSLKKNVLANYLGQGWSALMGIAFIPLIINCVGADAYGLIGVYAILQAWFTLLDMGMTPTLSREMARYTAGAHTSQSIRDLLRSLEVVCFTTAMFIGFAIWLSADWLAINWLHSDKLPVADVSQAISILALVVALRFIEGLYRGALMGLQKQVSLNMIGAVMATLRWAGACGVLMFVTPTIGAFFLWQGLVSMVTIVTFILALYKYLPDHIQPAKYSWIQIKSVWSFAGGMMTQTLLTLILTQMDKIILSRLLSLEMFGYYTLAGTFANVLGQMIAPITFAHLPRFTELVAKGDVESLIKIYHQGAQLVSVIIASGALILIFFGEDIIVLWGGDANLTQQVVPLMALLALGTMLNGLMHFPYILTLAYNWPGFFVRVNVVAIIILIPVIFWVTPRYGAIGAGWIWVVLNVGLLLIVPPIMYRRLLITEIWKWYIGDIVKPVMAAIFTAFALNYFHPELASNIFQIFWILVSGLCIVFASTFTAPSIRNNLFSYFLNMSYRR